MQSQQLKACSYLQTDGKLITVPVDHLNKSFETFPGQVLISHDVYSCSQYLFRDEYLLKLIQVVLGLKFKLVQACDCPSFATIQILRLFLNTTRCCMRPNLTVAFSLTWEFVEKLIRSFERLNNGIVLCQCLLTPLVYVSPDKTMKLLERFVIWALNPNFQSLEMETLSYVPFLQQLASVKSQGSP